MTNWPTKKLEEVCDLVTRGISPKYVGDGIVVLNQKCIRDHKITFLEARMHDTAKTFPDEKLIKVGDVLVNSTGVGTMGRVAQVKSVERPTVADSHITIVRPAGNIFYPDYFGWAMIFVEDLIMKMGTGSSGQIELSRAILKSIEIPVPPIGEQRRIAAKIEKQFAKIDEAARLRAESLTATDRLLPAALHEVFSKGKQKGWGEKELGSLCDILDNKRKPVTRRDRKSGPYPYYGATQVQDYVADYIFDEPLVLLGEDGARWGANESSAYEIEGKTWVNNHAHVLRPHRNELLDSWLVYNLNYADLSGYITGTTVKKLNQEKMRSIKVPLPPLVEQQKIVKKLDALSEKVRALRELQLAQAADLKTLKQSILHEAFA